MTTITVLILTGILYGMSIILTGMLSLKIYLRN